MGYTTDFMGEFKIDKAVDAETARILHGLSTTRRMKRSVPEEYGVDGEFYFGSGFAGQDHEENIVDYNNPPSTQPGLWCQWELLEDKQTIVWDGAEKFYEYIDWITYIIEKVLKPRGYSLTGEVVWGGEDRGDVGKIIINSNIVEIQHGKIVYYTNL